MNGVVSYGKRIAAGAAILVVMGCAGSGADKSRSDAPPLAIRNCEALAGMVVPSGGIGLPTRGAVVSSAVRAPAVAPYPDAEGEHLLPTPERCLVLGAIAPVDDSAPPIRFAVNLPLTNWNGRALQSGGGGLGGAIITAPGNKASGRFDPNPVDTPYPITRGYVTFGSDQGHSGTDFAFMQRDEAVRNWAYEEIKKTKDVAVAVIRAAYGRAPRQVFFSGESAGGREALRAAQKFPDDYDGVIATSPVISWNLIHLADNNTRDKLIGGFLDAAAIRLVADRTRASCDAADGLRDGVVARYLECANDAAALRCADGRPGPGCLSDAQIAAVAAHREPFAAAVSMAHGVTRFPGYGVTGEEDGPRFQWAFYSVGTVAPSLQLAPGRGFEPNRGAILNFGAWWVRHAIVRDEAFNPHRFDPRPHAARIRYLSDLFDATDPDLFRFAARGGRLLIVHPSADNAAPLAMTAEYYRSVVARLGQAAADRFMRLYVGPGGSHNVGGTTQVDALAMLEDWVLRNEAPPDAPIAYDKSVTDARTLRSLPACRYPAYPRYDGRGDVNAASSFTCTARPDPLGARAAS